MLVQALMVALSGCGLLMTRWLLAAPQQYFAPLPVPAADPRGPLTLDSDYRGLVL